jgi:hypothetical protein
MFLWPAARFPRPLQPHLFKAFNFLSKQTWKLFPEFGFSKQPRAIADEILKVVIRCTMRKARTKQIPINESKDTRQPAGWLTGLLNYQTAITERRLGWEPSFSFFETSCRVQTFQGLTRLASTQFKHRVRPAAKYVNHDFKSHFSLPFVLFEWFIPKGVYECLFGIPRTRISTAKPPSMRFRFRSR